MGGASEQVVIARAVKHQSAGFDIFRPGLCRGEAMLCRQVHNLLALEIEDGISQY